MAIPVILGALFLVLLDSISEGLTTVEALPLLVGFFSAFISGYFALRCLIHFLEKGRLYLFWNLLLSGRNFWDGIYNLG